MLKRFSMVLPAGLQAKLDEELARIKEERLISRIRDRDASVWTGGDEGKWLGWLDIPKREQGDLAKYEAISNALEEFDDIALLGMGGSSLCPDVLSKIFGVGRFHVLDSTVPDQVARLTHAIDPARTLFIVASKSGTTLEPNIFLGHFFDLVSAAKGKQHAGGNFVAVTDPGSKLEAIAERDGFRNVFLGDPQIGGRFSALSVFGMAPASAMGLDVGAIIEGGVRMAEECYGSEPSMNAGAVLGALLGTCWKEGRDKLEILASPSVSSMGAWMEQLIAESTGKEGKAIIPFDLGGRVSGNPGRKDRVFAYLRTSEGFAQDHEEFVELLKAAGEPVITIEMDEKTGIGAEFFRWEFATAVAGAVMGIDPFNQPDVESAKVEARKLTDAYEETGELPEEKEFFEGGGVSFFTNAENRVAIGEHGDAKGIVNAHFERITPGDHAAILAYVDMNDENIELLERIRTAIVERYGVSVSLQFGPRFLHSTGQAFKGGSNSGVFLQVSSDDAEDIDVPGKDYTFGVVKDAQARGDFQILLDRGRRALRAQFEGPSLEALRKLESMIV
ncbi:MAG: transaldolase [Acidobacteriota bacterium]|nr:MAG: transaldolase [Acidobacteriota bacterium]